MRSLAWFPLVIVILAGPFLYQACTSQQRRDAATALDALGAVCPVLEERLKDKRLNRACAAYSAADAALDGGAGGMPP